MLVPRTRLLVIFGALVPPAALLAATLPEAAVAAWALVGLLAIVLITDAVAAPGRLRGLSLHLPDLVRMQKGRLSEFTVEVQSTPPRAQTIRIGLSLPPEIESTVHDLWLAIPGDAERSSTTWSCTPHRRGRYRMETAQLEATSPLGFWAVRRKVPVEAEVRVYPDLYEERKTVGALFLRRSQLGHRVRRQAGKGRDFEKLRDYQPGDGADEIHWKASAKRGRPITKVFQVEQTQEVYVIVDGSRLSGREVAKGTTMLERWVTVALLLGLAAEQQGDSFGLLAFNDQVRNFVRARSGAGHFQVLRESLFAFQPAQVSPDFEEVASFIRRRLRKRALLVFLTNLDDPVIAASFSRSMELLCRQHLVLVNTFRPPAARPVFTSDDPATLDAAYEQMAGHLVWHDLRELGRDFRRRGMRLHLLAHERAALEVVSQYMEIRERQLV